MLSNYLIRADRLVKVGLLGLLFYVPLTIGAGTFDETKGIIFAVLTLLGVVWLLLQWEEGQITGFLRNFKLILLLIAFFLVSSLSFLYHPINIYGNLNAFLIVISYLLVYIIIISRVKDQREIGYFIWTITITAALVAIKALMQYFYEFSYLSQHIAAENIPLSLEHRVFSTFISPNAMAGFLLLVLPLSIILSEIAGNSQKKLFAFILSMLIFTGLLLTFSRAGWFIAVLLFVVLVVLGPRDIRKGILSKIFVIAILLLCALVSLFFLQNFKTSLLNVLSPEIFSASIKGRVDFWTTSWKIFRAYPYLGSGLGTFASIFPQFQISGHYSQHAHNTYLEMFAEMGIIGGSAFLVLLIGTWAGMLSSWWSTKDVQNRAIILGLGAGAFGFLIHNFLSFSWYIPANGIYFWSISGLAVSMAVKRREYGNATKIHGLHVTLFLWIVLLSVAAILMWNFLNLASAGEYAQQGRTALTEGMWDDAVINLTKATNLNPYNSDYKADLAQGYSAQAFKYGDRSKLMKAVDEIKKAVELQPRSAKFHGMLGNFYFQLGYREKALKEWKIAEELYPKNPVYRTLSGKALLELDRKGEAIKEFKNAISLSRFYESGKIGIPLLLWKAQSGPRSIYDAFLYLANIFLEEGRNEEAGDMYKQAINFSPQDITAYEGLGSIYLQEAEYSQAIEVYQRIVEIDGKNQDARLKLGNLYERIGQYSKAEDVYRAILSIEPDNQEAKKALKSLPR